MGDADDLDFDFLAFLTPESIVDYQRLRQFANDLDLPEDFEKRALKIIEKHKRSLRPLPDLTCRQDLDAADLDPRDLKAPWFEQTHRASKPVENLDAVTEAVMGWLDRAEWGHYMEREHGDAWHAVVGSIDNPDAQGSAFDDEAGIALIEAFLAAYKNAKADE